MAGGVVITHLACAVGESFVKLQTFPCWSFSNQPTPFFGGCRSICERSLFGMTPRWQNQPAHCEGQNVDDVGAASLIGNAFMDKSRHQTTRLVWIYRISQFDFILFQAQRNCLQPWRFFILCVSVVLSFTWNLDVDQP